MIGESGAAWIIAEDAEGMILIDQHAAHERVKFEELLESPDLLESEPLLLNWSISVDRADKSEVAQLRKNLESLGFEFSDASIAKNELVVIAIPRSQRKIDWKALIDGFFDKLEDGRLVQGAVEELRHKIASSLACHGSVRKGRRLKREEIEALLSSLDGLDWGGFCPHGRPIYFRLNHAEIEQRFHR